MQSPGDPQSLNRYAYARNNPLAFIDPTGHFFWLIGVIIGAIIGATIAAITGGNILLGALTGGITGGFLGAASAIVAAADLTGVAAAGVYAASGLSAGAINAAICGSNIGMGALMGGAFATAAYFMPGNLKIFSEGPGDDIANQVGASSVRLGFCISMFLKVFNIKRDIGAIFFLTFR